MLHDFGAFLSFIGQQGIPLTGMRQLRRRLLPEINARLTRPLQHGLTKPLQKSYPHIHGLYLLVRASGLTVVGGTKRKPWLFVDELVQDLWDDLNPTEQYCTLLETWLLRGHPEIIGERYRAYTSPFDRLHSLLWFLMGIPRDGLSMAEDKDAQESVRYRPGLHNLALLELFGLVEVEHGSPIEGKGWVIARIARTSLGEALFVLLDSHFFAKAANRRALEKADTIPVGSLQPVLRPYFSEWRQNLSLPPWPFRPGTHVFKVSLGGMWRRIAVPGSRSLDELASIILDAVKFRHDHLYRFSYYNRSGVEKHIYHPDLGDEPLTSEWLIGDVPLRIDQSMTFLFDFGDSWKFDVTLESVDAEKIISKPIILEKHGQPPSQYGW